MEDSHLINTIRVLKNKIQQCVAVLTNTIAEDPLITAFQPSFSRERIMREAKEQIVYYHERISPYIMEACLRGLQVTSLLQEAYGRTSQVSMGSSLMLEPMDDDDENDDLDF